VTVDDEVESEKASGTSTTMATSCAELSTGRCHVKLVAFRTIAGLGGDLTRR